MSALAALYGAGVGLGLLAVIAGLRGAPFPTLRLSALSGPVASRRLGVVAGAVGAGLAVWLVTGWPVGAVLAGLAALSLPGLLAGPTAHKAAVARIEAVATWTEMLRDTLAGAAGLEQTIIATAPVAPASIRPAVGNLALALERQPLPGALRAFAQELADPTGDLVVAALVHAAGRPAGQLGEQLGALARTARDEATMRLRVAAGRARVHTTVRVIVLTTLVMAALLVALSRDYLSPYDSPGGQLLLAGVGIVFALALRWLAAMGRPPAPRRILATATDTDTGPGRGWAR